MQQESPLYTHTVRGNAADGECLVDATSPDSDNHTLYHLHTFTVTFYDANVNLHCVPRCNVRDFFFEILNGSNQIDCVCHSIATLPSRFNISR